MAVGDGGARAARASLRHHARHHATWTARRLSDDDEPVLPDRFAEVRIVSPDGRLDFTFPDLDGNPVSLADPRFAGRVVLVEIFGTWCPNCNEQARLMERLYSEAAATLPALSAIKSYPTAIFIGRDGRPRRIHSGFKGPATGRQHERLLRASEQEIERLLAEPASG